MKQITHPEAAPLIERVERLLADPETALALGAALRARAAGAPDELVLAALLHQVAAGGTGEPRVAAAWLSRAFGPAVSEPVRLLGDAERWLATVDRDWFEALDTAGLTSLGARGGPLAPAAQRSFERRPYARDAARLVRWISAERRGEAHPLGAPEHVSWAELIDRLVSPTERLSA
ncbi:MAG: hypothetical protein R3F49_03610 [Planctomycetota bacterium]